MCKGNADDSKENMGENQDKMEMDNKLQDSFIVKGNKNDIQYFITSYLKEQGIAVDQKAGDALTEFWIDISSLDGDNKGYTASVLLPGTKRLLVIDKSLLLSLVITIAGAAITLNEPSLSAGGVVGTVGGLVGSCQEIKKCLLTINRDELCVLLCARKKKRGIITPVNLQKQLKECPHAQLYEKVYGERCLHCSYNPQSSTRYECHLSEEEIRKRLIKIAENPQYEIEYSEEEDIFRLKK